jgi:hypothetical protein
METKAQTKNAICNTCTIKLVKIAYQRAPWFRLVREPFKSGMQFLSWVYRVDPGEYKVRTPSCYRCIRFYKLGLKDRSGLFCWLNDRLNPVFDNLLEQIVTKEEIENARDYARSSTSADEAC